MRSLLDPVLISSPAVALTQSLTFTYTRIAYSLVTYPLSYYHIPVYVSDTFELFFPPPLCIVINMVEEPWMHIRLPVHYIGGNIMILCNSIAIDFSKLNLLNTFSYLRYISI